MATPSAVKQGYELWGGPKEYWLAGIESGASADYGHSDLIFGLRAPDEVFPRVRDWLIEKS